MSKVLYPFDSLGTQLIYFILHLPNILSLNNDSSSEQVSSN